jgi:hypothetical protein
MKVKGKTMTQPIGVCIIHEHQLFADVMAALLHQAVAGAGPGPSANAREPETLHAPLASMEV